MKTVKITEKNIQHLSHYQETKKLPIIGEELTVVETGVPYPMRRGTFAILTDESPHANARFICRRDGKAFVPFDNFANCNRWALPTKFLK